MNNLISQNAAWSALQVHQQSLAKIHLRDLFAQDKQRFEHFSFEFNGLLFDYSKNHLTNETVTKLLDLATATKLADWIARMFKGEKLNNTEQRAALHIALRNRSNHPIFVDGQDVMPAINAVLAKMRKFSDLVQEGKWRGYTGKPIKAIVNIGIGGSDLGPAMVTKALTAYHHPRLQSYFVSNVDSTHLGTILAVLDPETTLFTIASKNFTTQETLLNANSARQWLIDKLGNAQAVAKHFVAVSTAKDKVTEFGIDPNNMFEFWDWVGGRYSLWSAIGLPIALMIGMDRFEQLLNGAHELDKHFATAPFSKNMPVLMGLIGVWYSSFFKASSHAVLPYDYALELLPAYLQQLLMESLGKCVTREGNKVDYSTCPIIWGAPGNNGQHAFYQLLHQGTHLVPADFILAIESQYGLPEHQDAVLSNALAQTYALMNGRTAEETRQTLQINAETEQLSHRVFAGNQPTNTLLYQKLTPYTLGMLIALYEHKTFVQGVCWDINPFDQWGVELGKQVASTLLPALQNANVEHTVFKEPATAGLLNYILKTRCKK